MHSAILVSVTPNAETEIVYCARVSNPKNQSNETTAPKLLRYLIKHRHWSPFELAHMVVEINTTRSVAAQLLRHRSFSFQEFSQRYSSVAELPEIDMPELRMQDPKAKQLSYGKLPYMEEKVFQARISDEFTFAKDLYEDLLEAGAARETARDVLPLATPTRLYMSGTLRSWIHYFQARCHKDTQKEHRAIAQSIRGIFDDQFPSISVALLAYEQEEAEKAELYRLYQAEEISHKSLGYGWTDDYGVKRSMAFKPCEAQSHISFADYGSPEKIASSTQRLYNAFAEAAGVFDTESPAREFRGSSERCVNGEVLDLAPSEYEP